ncbi:PAS domain-containing protein [Aliiroseovarius crassostreae]|uniref:two-component system sensor histidine kinase NtrB n=1 Tax=Aliiroseovarius crassostreae TaxID=154981 RepID=UPI00220871C5|nr:ATP-binding protein [Aliiroseovarius crassostreae]UWQ02921.1 PAS domain-containing protein [Aliiroseovarius crassostreae]
MSDLLWSALPIPALILSKDGQVEEVNAAGEALLNQSERALLGRGMVEVLQLGPELGDAIERVRASQGTMYADAVKFTPHNTPPGEVNIQISPIGEGALLLLHPRQPEQLGQEKGSKAARQAIGMAEMLAHEIKNPLAGITGAAQLLSMGLSPEDQELTDLIVAESRRIVALLDQVEQFGDLRPPVKHPVNIHDLLDRARTTARVGFADGCSINELYDPSLPLTFVDEDQLMQVFLNLIKNASEAAGSAGSITLRTFYDAGLHRRGPDGTREPLPLQVEVIDDGPGLPPDIADHVFDPFVSGRENGTGLGLALVSKILTDHGGLITVNSQPGRTVFRVSLPVVPDPGRARK